MAQNQKKQGVEDVTPQDAKKAAEDTAQQAQTEAYEQTPKQDIPSPDEGLEGAEKAAEKPKKEEEPDFKDKYIRAVAEMENLRKRLSRDVEDARQYAVTGFAREMLDVSDNLERALAAIDQEKAAQDPQLKNLIEGVEMVHGQLQRTFGKFKIEKTSPKPGEKFNPELHQAMFEMPTTDYPQGTVAQVMQPGYVIAGRLLRPAMVGTAKPPEKENEQEAKS